MPETSPIQVLPSAVPGIRRLRMADERGVPTEVLELSVSRAQRVPSGGVFASFRKEDRRIVLGPDLARTLAPLHPSVAVVLALAERLLRDLSVLHLAGGAHGGLDLDGIGFDAKGTFTVRPCLHVAMRPGTPHEGDVAAVGQIVATLAPELASGGGGFERGGLWLGGMGVGRDRVPFPDARAARQALVALIGKRDLQPDLDAFLASVGGRLPPHPRAFDVRPVATGQMRASVFARDAAAAEARAWVVRELDRVRAERYRIRSEGLDAKAVGELRGIVTAARRDADEERFSDAVRTRERWVRIEAQVQGGRPTPAGIPVEPRRGDPLTGPRVVAERAPEPTSVPLRVQTRRVRVEPTPIVEQAGGEEPTGVSMEAGLLDDVTRPVPAGLLESVLGGGADAEELEEGALAEEEIEAAERAQEAEAGAAQAAAELARAEAAAEAAEVARAEAALAEVGLEDAVVHEGAGPSEADVERDAVRAFGVEEERFDTEEVDAAGVAEAEGVEAERVEAARVAEEAARVEAARVEAERLAAEEAARVEAERVAAEEAARVEADRVAAEEAERLAAEEAARVEAERLAAEEAARVEAERVAAEQAEAERLAAEDARAEAERAAQDAARAEAARIAEAQRAEVARLAAEAALVEAAEAARLARVELPEVPARPAPKPPGPAPTEDWDPAPTQPGVSLEAIESGRRQATPAARNLANIEELAPRSAPGEQPLWSGAVGVTGNRARENEKGPGKWVESGRSPEELAANLPGGGPRPLSLEDPPKPPYGRLVVGGLALLAVLLGVYALLAGSPEPAPVKKPAPAARP